MKPVSSIVALRPATSFINAHGLRASTIARSYATQNTQGPTPLGPRRRGVTPFNDDGYVPWKELSVPEKAARATQQSFNFGLVLVGLVLTVSTLRNADFAFNFLLQPESNQRYTGRRWISFMDGRFFAKQQNGPVQPSHRQDQEGRAMSGAFWRRKEDSRPRRGNKQ